MSRIFIIMLFYVLVACNGVSDYKKEIAQMQTNSIVLPLNEMNCILKGNIDNNRGIFTPAE